MNGLWISFWGKERKKLWARVFGERHDVDKLGKWCAQHREGEIAVAGNFNKLGKVVCAVEHAVKSKKFYC